MTNSFSQWHTIMTSLCISLPQARISSRGVCIYVGLMIYNALRLFIAVSRLALAKIKATKIEYKAEAETQLSFEENVMKDMANN